jgi:hypothetical protein
MVDYNKFFRPEFDIGDNQGIVLVYHAIVIWFLSEKEMVFGNQFAADFHKMGGMYSPFGFDVGLVCHKFPVTLVMIEINEIHYAAEYGFSKIGFVRRFG